jgi:acyl transferase domain-containing protein
LRDGDRVYALIRGSAVNQDGASGGLTVPSGEAQEEVIRTALAQAGVAPAAVSYVEAHGTGTRLGDAIELRALAGALGEGREPSRPLLVGSVKTNVGHLEAAAGVTGLIKTVLALRHEEIPAHLHVTAPTRQVAWERLPLKVTTGPVPWPRGDGHARLAGISAFGFTGTNAHVLIEEAPESAASGQPGSPEGDFAADVSSSAVVRPYVLTGSALTPAALSAAANRLRDRIVSAQDGELADLCWVSGARRTHHEHRFAVVGRTGRELADGLAAVARAEYQDAESSGVLVGAARRGEQRGLALAFGDAAALPSPALLNGDPAGAAAFRAALASADAAARAAGLDASPERAWRTGEVPRPGTPADRVLTLAVQLGMAALWEALGVSADAVLAHGTGEFAAACVAGEITVAEAMTLLAAGYDHVAPGAGRLPRWSTGEGGWSAAADRLVTEGIGAVLDIGTGSPAATLLSGALRDSGADVLVLAAPDGRGGPGPDYPARVAATLHVNGCAVDWSRLVPEGRRVVSLPTYPWQRVSHWVGRRADAETASTYVNGAAAVDGVSVGAGAGTGTLSTYVNGVPDGAGADAGIASTSVNGATCVNAVSVPDAAPASTTAPATRTASTYVNAVHPVDAAPADAAPAPADTPLVARLRALAPAPRSEHMLDTLLALVGEVLGESADIAPDQGFFDLGMDSVLSTELKRRAEEELGVELPGTILFECPNARTFAEFALEELFGAAPEPVPAPATAPTAVPATGPTVDAEDAAALEELDDDALVERLMAALAGSESLLTEGDRP